MDGGTTTELPAPVIQADGVSRRFAETLAIDDVSFSVDQGGIAAFLGPNGSGKTTLVRLLNGVLAPDEGHITVFGTDVTVDQNAVQRHSGVVTETLSLYVRFSGRYNLSFFGRLFGMDSAAIANRIDELSALLDFRSYLDERVDTYSTGMKKRLQLARALLHDPDLLFLDEPTSGLDPQASKLVVDHIAQISQEREVTVVLCTHDLQVAERLADRMFFLDTGRIVASGAPADLRAELWPAITVEVNVDRWSDTIGDELATEPWARVQSVDDSPQAGDGSVVQLELANRDDIPRLVETLVAADVRVYGVTEDRHSLEDMYFSVRERVR